MYCWYFGRHLKPKAIRGLKCMYWSVHSLVNIMMRSGSVKKKVYWAKVNYNVIMCTLVILETIVWVRNLNTCVCLKEMFSYSYKLDIIDSL